MKYKFIGTEQDLIDNGFTAQNSHSTLKSSTYFRGGLNITIRINAKKHNSQVVKGLNHNKRLLQDLIDKGLVVEV